MRFMTFMLVFALCAGCAEARYRQEGKSVKQTEQDTYVCEDTILKEYKGLRNLNDKEIQTLMDRCMQAKGYRTKT